MTIASFLMWLAGCDLPSAEWTKPGATREQFDADDDSCQEDVKDNKFNFGVGAATGPNKKEFYEKCMKDLGYQRVGEKTGYHFHNPMGVLVSAGG